MNNPPDAVARLFDAYADRIYRYCWFMLRNRDFALIALRDTLVVAHAQGGPHAGGGAQAQSKPHARGGAQDQSKPHAQRAESEPHADPGAFESWLYALARTECRRRRQVPPADADVPPARPQQPDADSRLLAWNAVTSMDADEIEVLELACRHQVDLAAVLGKPEAEVRALRESAAQGLEAALAAEVLVSRVSHACPDRAQVLRGWAGTMTAEFRDRVLRHAAACPVCGPNVPRNVSAARVFALLPSIALPADARDRVLAFFTDPRMAAYREFAVARAGGQAPRLAARPANPKTAPQPANHKTPPPAPVAPRRGARARSRSRARSALLALVGATAAATAFGVTFALTAPGGGTHLPGGKAHRSPGGEQTTGQSAGAQGAFPVGSPTADAPPLPGGPRAGSPGNPGQLLVDKVTRPAPTGPVITPPLPMPPRQPVPGGSVPPPAGSIAVSPSTVYLGPGAQATVTITASGTAESWSATASSSQVSVSPASGTLRPGQSRTITITVTRIAGVGGSADIYVSASNALTEEVQVCWAPDGSRPSPPPPPPSPDPSQSPSPSAPPTPSPPAPTPAPSPSTSVSADPSRSASPSQHGTPPPSSPPASTPATLPATTPAPTTTQDTTPPPSPASSPAPRP